jgi:hypothetical protein
MATDVQMVGAEQLQSTLRRAGQKVQDMSAANGEVAALAASAAQPPRRTGRLAGSIRPTPSATEAAVSVAQPYAGPIENGWPAHNISATHFLRDAFDSIRSAADDIYAKAGQAVLDDVKGA